MRRVALISCGKSKGPAAAPARSLYTGALFRKSLAYAEHTCDEAAVLSAKHGLISMDTVIEPYEQTLTAMPLSERRAWGRAVTEALVQRYPPAEWVYVYLAGAVYRTGLPPGEDPLGTLPFGFRLRWLGNRLVELPDHYVVTIFLGQGKYARTTCRTLGEAYNEADKSPRSLIYAVKGFRNVHIVKRGEIPAPGKRNP